MMWEPWKKNLKFITEFDKLERIRVPNLSKFFWYFQNVSQTLLYQYHPNQNSELKQHFHPWSGSIPAGPSEEYNMPDNWINTNFRLRVMHGGRSFFLITDTGLTFEYLNAENVWLWLRHEHLTAMRGAVGHYNGSLFLVDEHGSLLIRERSNSDLAWINCTGMRKGRQVIGGPPWDRLPGKTLKVTVEDALFFVSRTGRLLQFTVSCKPNKNCCCLDCGFVARFLEGKDNIWRERIAWFVIIFLPLGKSLLHYNPKAGLVYLI